MSTKKLALMQVLEQGTNRILKSAEVPLSSVAIWEKNGFRKVREIIVDEPAVKPEKKYMPTGDEQADGSVSMEDGEQVPPVPVADDFAKLKGVKPEVAELLKSSGYDSFKKLKVAEDDELLDIQGIGEKTLEKVRDALDALED